MTTSEPSFGRSINTLHSAEDSVVLRYMDLLRFEDSEDRDGQFKQLLKKISIQEGARIFPLLEYRGVKIHLMDETSRMHTHTLKSIDGCVSAAKCKLRGYERVVFESGANTGTALTVYGANAALETFFFLPEENLPLVDRTILTSSKMHLISVDHPGFVKRAARLFGRMSGAKHIPEIAWRYQASQLRGCFVLEHVLGHGRFDWLTQSVSAAFGPIGIFKILWRYERQGGKPPRFLGIQQEENCPMYRFWNNGSGKIKPMPVESTNRLLTKTMYDFASHTYGTYADLKQLLHRTRGGMVTVNRREFEAFLGRRFCGQTIVEILRTNGINIGPEVLETTGLMALAGTFKEIDEGTIPTGAKILCCLTSGVCTSDGKAEPERRLRSRRIQKELSMMQG